MLFVAKSDVFRQHIKLMSRRKTLKIWIRGILRLFEEVGIEPGSKVLDIFCATGRIAIPLAARGYFVTGVDFSPSYIAEARAKAEKRGVSDRARFVEGDARNLDKLLGGEVFDAALWLWASIGYYEEEDDEEILRLARRHVRGGGALILDTPNRDVILKEYEPMVVEKIGRYLYIYHHSFDPFTSRLRTRWDVYRVTRKTLRLVASIPVDIRLYSLHELVRMLERTGWEVDSAYGSYKLEPFNPKESRMIVVRAIAV